MKTIVVATAAALAAAPAHARCTAGATASWYGEPQKVRSGKRFDPNGVTCAHRKYPDGTVLRVTDLDTRRQVDCVVNDFGPNASTGCQVDLARGAAAKLGMLDKGVARASIEVRPARAAWAVEHRWPG